MSTSTLTASYRSSADAQQDVYVAGEIETGEPLDVAVAVNGRIGGWAELAGHRRPRRAPLLGPGPARRSSRRRATTPIELYVIEGDGPDPALAPLASAGDRDGP